VLIAKFTPLFGDKVEEMDTIISSMKEVVVVDSPLGGIKRHHEKNNFDSNKKLVHLNKSDLYVLTHN